MHIDSVSYGMLLRPREKGMPNCLARNLGTERSASYLGSGGEQMLHDTIEFSYNLLDPKRKHVSETLAPNSSPFCSLLRSCIENKSWADGKLLHNQMVKAGCQPSLLLGDLLLQLYVGCGCVKDARKVFNTLPYRNLNLWGCLFGCYADQQQWEEVLSLFWQMLSDDGLPNHYICVIVLQACGHLQNLVGGKAVYSCVIKSGCAVNQYVASALISMYVKGGCVHDARFVFDEISSRNFVLWSAMIAGYAHQGHPEEAIKLFWQMKTDDCLEPSDKVCLTVLSACANAGAHHEGRKVHDCIVRNSFDLKLSIGNCLIYMYAKCGCLMDARRVFDKMEQPDYISWSTMVAAYGEFGDKFESFLLFSAIERKGVHANEFTFLNLLKRCEGVEYLNKVREVHTHIITRGVVSTGRLENVLVSVLAKCGALEDAYYVFRKLSIQNVVSWGSLIVGHTHHGLYEDALVLFNQMVEEDVRLNSTISVSVLKVTAVLKNLEVGRCIHSVVSEEGLETEVFVGSALVDMYAKCGAVKDAREVFDCMPTRNIVAWTSMMACYAQQTVPEEAIELFWCMRREGVKPDEVTFVSILKACTIWAMLEQGRRIHDDALDVGNRKASCFLGSTLVDMYTRCGSLVDARRVFDEIEERDVALWNAMISGYGQYGFALDAFELRSQMSSQGVSLNHVTFVGLLSACSHAGCLDEGLEVYAWISLDDSILKTTEQCVCLIDLLGRAGCRPQAAAFVQEMPLQPDVTVWLSLVGVCRLNFDMELATAGVRSLLEIEPENAEALVLLSNIVYEVD